MKISWLCIIVVCALLFPHGVLSRQFVEVERRPNNNHESAGKFSFVFGLTATFIELLVAGMFIFSMWRISSPAAKTRQEPVLKISLPSLSTATKPQLIMNKWTL